MFEANLAPIGSLQEAVNLHELLRSKDAEIAALNAAVDELIKDREYFEQQNARLRAALTASGIPAQAALDDLAPPLRINVSRAKEIMGGVDNG